jgi:hypothetical protein
MDRLSDLLDGFDEASFQLGIIDAFCEMVSVGVKGLALSHPLVPEEFARLEKAATAIAERYTVHSHAERDFIATDLAPTEAVAGKVVMLFYRDEWIITAYGRLKAEVAALQEAGAYTPAARRDITARLRMLLGHPAQD